MLQHLVECRIRLTNLIETIQHYLPCVSRQEGTDALQVSVFVAQGKVRQAYH